MVVGVLLMIFLALVSIALWAYARILLTSAAADAARHVANADVGPGVATERVVATLSDGPVAGVGATVSCTTGIEGLLVAVTCTMDSPGVVSMLDGILPTITVTGHSVEEATP